MNTTQAAQAAENVDSRNPRDAMQAAMTALKLTIDSAFVPWSQSRNKAEKHKSLNWRVTLKRDGREILTTDYSAGIAHAPSYPKLGRGTPILPDSLDVLHSLISDSDVLDAGGFESWASDFGYDADSRKAESIYRACLDIALKLRAGIGEAGLATLREAAIDY